MKRVLKPIDYNTKDYEGFRQLMLDLIPQYTPEWTDTTQSDFGVVMIELLANGLDILSYYQDKNFSESFLPTAKTRQAVINICRMLGYELGLQTPAIHLIEFEKDPSFIDDTIIIPKGTKIGTDLKIGAQEVFELLDRDVILQAGQSSATALATHGQTMIGSVLGASNGTGFQSFKVPYPDVLLDTLDVVTIENGRPVLWEIVADFLSSEQDDRHYTTLSNESNEMIINFGNGLSGRIPSNNVLIQANYRVGGGEIGNVGTGTITEFVDKEFAGVTLRNTSLHQKGIDVEDIEKARIVAPRYFRNAGRAVTKQDFEDIVMSIIGVTNAKCIETFNSNRDVLIYVAPNGFGQLTQGLKDTIQEKLNQVKLVHDNPIIYSTDYTNFNIDLDVITYSNYVNSEVSARVQDALREVFDIKYMEYGEDIFLTSIVKEVMSVEGVRNVVIKSPLTDIEVLDISIAKLGDVIVNTTGGVDI